jgi:hypothetical protein
MSGTAKSLVLTLPLVGRVARLSEQREAMASGVGVERVWRYAAIDNSDPHPQPLPTRGRGAHLPTLEPLRLGEKVQGRVAPRAMHQGPRR